MKLLAHMKATHRPAPPPLSPPEPGTAGAATGSVEVVTTKPGDVMIFRVPEKYFSEAVARENIVNGFNTALQELGVKAILIPEWVKLEFLVTPDQRKAEA